MQRQGFRVFDSHVHFPYGWSRPATQPKPELVEYGRQRSRRFALEWDFPSDAPNFLTRQDGKEPTWEEMADLWAAEVEKYDLIGVNFVTGGGNEVLGKVVRRHPKIFTGMVHHNVWEDGALDKLKQAVEEYGLWGYKMLGPRIPISMDDPKLEPIWEYLAAHRMPVLIHFGALGHAGGIVYHPNMSPLVLGNVVKRWPEIPFQIPHFGCTAIQDLLVLCWNSPSIYVDTSGSNQWMRWMPYPMTTEIALRKFYELIGPERIVFGTDSSWFPRGFSYRYLQDQVRDCRHMNMKQEDLALIFGQNALRLYRFEDQRTPVSR